MGRKRKERGEEKRFIKFCPSCGSNNVKWELPQTWSVWKCWDCGYVGAFIIEDGIIATEIRKDYLKRTGLEKPKETQKSKRKKSK
jgi:ribosomal protein L37AE/L43A